MTAWYLIIIVFSNGGTSTPVTAAQAGPFVDKTQCEVAAKTIEVPWSVRLSMSCVEGVRPQ